MAYSKGTLSKVYDSLESSVTFWIYTTADSIPTVLGTGYFSDATDRRLKLGDIIEVFSGTLVSATAGLALGAVTFPSTVGVSSLFSSAPSRVTAMVTTLGTPTTTTPGAATVTGINVGSSDTPLDLVQAGDFTINPWQLGTSLPFSSTVTTGPDRFFGIGGASSSAQMVRTANTDIPGFTAAVAVGRSATDTHTVGLTFGQVIESMNAVRAQGKPVAVSFYHKAGTTWAPGATSGVVNGALTATLIAGTGTDDTDANLVAGSWTGASTVGQITVTPGSVTTRAAFNGTVPLTATQLGLLFNFTPVPTSTAGANENVQLLAIGAKLGPDNGLYEHKAPGDVLDTCLRYLQVISEPTSGVAVGTAVFSAASIAQAFIPLLTPMRKAPTISFTAGGFAVTDSALAAHTVSSGGGVGNTTSLTLTLTAAATLTAGLVSTLAGRTTGSGSIVARAGYEG